jgi:hypothetical protein
MMRRTLPFIAIMILFLNSCKDSGKSSPASSGSDSTKNEIIEDDQATDPATLDSLFIEQIEKSDSSFSAENFEGGEMTDAEIPESTLDTTEIQPYLPYLVYNNSRTKAIDAVSANYFLVKKKGKIHFEEGGPDFEVALIDFEKNTRKRILFFGTTGTVYDSRWLNDQTIVLTGALNQTMDSMQPVIWKYDLQKGSKEMFVYPQMVAWDLTKNKNKTGLPGL